MGLIVSGSAYVLLLTLLFQVNELNGRRLSRRGIFLCSVILTGGLIAAGTELPSIFDAFTSREVTLFWLSIALTSLGINGVLFFRYRRIPDLRIRWRLTKTESVLLGGVIVIGAATFFTGLLFPPNTFDSMTYHLPRVMHWIENRSVAHYYTNISRQLFDPPWTEFAIAHLQLLWGSDRFAFFVQWMAMVCCVVAVSEIAKMIGGSRNVQLMASVFCATLPMGILQSSSTQTDYTASLWFVATVWAVLAYHQKPTSVRALLIGAALGLGMLTKTTVIIYALPVAVLYAVIACRLAKSKALLHVAAAACVAFVLVGNHWYRNWNTFQSPFSERTYSRENLVTQFSMAGLFSNTVKMSSIHFSTPFKTLNDGIGRMITGVHDIAGISVLDPRTTYRYTGRFMIRPLSADEDTSGNPAHFVLLILCAAAAIASIRVRKNFRIMIYGGALASGFVLFCSLVKFSFWVSRYQLPLFVAAAPLSAIVLSRVFPKKNLLVGIALLACAIPYALHNHARPLTEIFKTGPINRLDYLFVNNPGIRADYVRVADEIARSGCTRIGFESGFNDWEYPLWALLHDKGMRAPRIVSVKSAGDTVATGNAIGQSASAAPCAIVSMIPVADRIRYRSVLYRKICGGEGIGLYIKED